VISKTTLAAHAAWLQLVESRTNIEIAELLGVSRLRVPKLVRWAEDHDLADVAIHPPAGLDWALGEALRSEFGLVEALVSSDSAASAVSRLAARYVVEVLTEGGVLGVAWGRGAQGMAAELERMRDVPQVDVVQLIGGLPEPDTAWHATELLVRLSHVFGGNAAALLSPMVVPEVATAVGLRDEPSIAHAFEVMSRVDVAVVGVGAWVVGGSRVRAQLDGDDLSATEDVAADVCGVLLGGDGGVVHRELSRRIVSVEEQVLRACPVRLATVTGPGKVLAIRAALRSGLLTVLCTDSETAALVLEGSA
jgi:DNA-binding transcriptional regulator LsrR (DeoR family)